MEGIHTGTVYIFQNVLVDSIANVLGNSEETEHPLEDPRSRLEDAIVVVFLHVCFCCAKLL